MTRFLGFAGIVLFCFGAIPFALTGVFDLWTAVHLVGGSVLLAVGVVLNFARFRRSVAARGLRERLQALAGAVLFCGILVVANVAAERHPWRYDSTENRIHTLSPKTRAWISALERPVEILVFAAPGEPGRDAAEDLLERFAAQDSDLTWRFVDPVRDPEIAVQLGISRENVVVARMGDRTVQSPADDTLGITEGLLANLLAKLSRHGPRSLYVVTGHGEPAADDLQDARGLGGLSRALEDDDFTVRPLLLSAVEQVPADALVVLIVGPTKGFLDHEVGLLRDYLARGGRLLAMLDPGIDSRLGPLLADYRVAVGDDMIVDQEQIPFFGPRLGLAPIVENFSDHPITRRFHERIVLIQARSVDVSPADGLPGLNARVIARSREASWAESDYVGMLKTRLVEQDDPDRPGPVPLAVAVTRSLADDPSSGGVPESPEDGKDLPPETRLLVLGDSDIAKNANVGLYFNQEFLLNSVEWLAGHEAMIAMGPRGLRPSRLTMTEADYRNLFRLSVLLLPEALLIVGLGLWWRRRSL